MHPKRHRDRILITALLLLCGIAGGCTYKNQPLNALNVELENRVRNHTRAATGAAVLPTLSTQPANAAVLQPAPANHTTPASSNGYFVGLALSGGGSRSSNFAAACMFQLERLGILQHVNYISSVSGGSLPGAYYCLNDDAGWNPGVVQQKLTHSFATDLILQFISPWNLAAVTFTDYDRSDLLANSFNANLYSRDGRSLTFGDLRPDRPRLLINATDLQSGRRFVFCNESFDQLNSDLSKYPLAWAVAASSAVPVLLHQVTLRDFSTTFKQYRHFIDGGIVDNLGIESLVETYEAQNQAAVRDHQPSPYPNGAIFIVIDAKTHFNARLSDKGDIGLFESLKAASGLSSTALLSRASTASLAELIVKYSPDELTADKLRQQIEDLQKTGYLETRDRRARSVRIVHIALSELSSLGDKAPFAGFSESLDNIETYFNIDPTDAYNLYQAADLLVRERFEPLLKPMARELEAGGK
jgi:predicted acylesterase/phospholipase RssA